MFGYCGRGWRIQWDGTAVFDAASIRGIISADHIVSDVRNWERLWGGFRSTSASTAISFGLSATVSNFDVLYIEGLKTLGSSRSWRGVSLRLQVNRLVTGSNPLSFQNRPTTSLDFYWIYLIGRSSGQSGGVYASYSGRTLYLRSHSLDIFTVTKIWGIHTPS